MFFYLWILFIETSAKIKLFCYLCSHEISTVFHIISSLQQSSISYQQSVVKIYNALGMLVDEYEMNSGEIEINVSDYNSGIYFIDLDGVMNKVVVR